MFKKRISQAVLLISIFIICLFLTMPAHQAYKWGLYSQDIKLQGVSGQYLQGEARQLSANGIIINDVSWDWQVFSLLLGKLELEWQINDRNIHGQGFAAQSLLRIGSITDANLTLNTEILTPYLPKGNTVTGDIEVNIKSLHFQEKLNSIAANVKMNELSVQTMFGIIKIEHINLEATGNNNDGFHLVLTDFINANSVNILADIKQGKVVLSGSVSTQSDLAKQLKPILPLIAKKQGSNWLVSWKGTVPIL